MNNISEWHLILLWPWQRVIFIDGKRSQYFDRVWHRVVRGVAQYRLWTDEERAIDQADNAW